MKQPRRHYWDSSVFITALTKDKKYGEQTLQAACETLRLVTIGEAVIVSSTVLLTEVLPCKCTTEQYDQFQATLQSPFIIIRDMDVAVARKAAELRDACYRHKEKLRLPVADAAHMATFLVYEKDIDEINSYDAHFPSKFKWLGLAAQPVYPHQIQLTMPMVTDESEEEVVGPKQDAIDEEAGKQP